MTDFTPYRKLGVSEDASFEEIKDARDRLIVEQDGDISAQELVEAAYDAILMERLKARQQGKIKVPDRIRFPEKNVVPSPTFIQPVVNKNNLLWLSNLKDNPSRQNLLIYSGVFAGLFTISVLFPTTSNIWMSLALLASIYLLRRKENRFWRSILIGICGLIVGVSLSSGLLYIIVPLQFAYQISMGVIMFIMWLFTTLLR